MQPIIPLTAFQERIRLSYLKRFRYALFDLSLSTLGFVEIAERKVGIKFDLYTHITNIPFCSKALLSLFYFK